MPITRSRRWPALVLTGVAVALAAWASRDAFATEGFSYRWSAPGVELTWSEGNSVPELPGIQREMGHWKRLAAALARAKGRRGPLAIEASLYGPDLGSDGPRLLIRGGAAPAEKREAVTDQLWISALEAALGEAAGAGKGWPVDESDARLSPDGAWLAVVRWPATGPEVWLADSGVKSAMRVTPSASGVPVVDRLLTAPPAWNANGSLAAWVQGGRLLLASPRDKRARLVTPKERVAVGFQWCPSPARPSLGLVRYHDDSFGLIDANTSEALALSDLLKNSLPMSDFYWSPDGRYILFRSQSTIAKRRFSLADDALKQWERLIGKRPAGGAGADSAESSQERIARIDLDTATLESWSLAKSLLDGQELMGITWTGDAGVMLAMGLSGLPERNLAFLPFAAGGKPKVIRTTRNPLVALGAIGDAGSGNSSVTAAASAWMDGAELLTFAAGAPDTPVRSASIKAAVTVLPPGPMGGFRGVQGELGTESETPCTVTLLVSAGSEGGLGGKDLVTRWWRTHDGLVGVTASGSPLPALWRQSGVVDADAAGTTLLLTDTAEGVGRVRLLTAAVSESDKGVTLSDALAKITASELAPGDAVFAPTPPTEPKAAAGTPAAPQPPGETQPTWPIAIALGVGVLSALVLAALLILRRRK